MGLLRRRDDEFTAFVEQHGDALLRAAHFLTGDQWAAEDLLQLALTKTYLACPTARGAVSYAYARKVLISCHTDTWRRRRWREESTAPDDLPGCPSDSTAHASDAWSDPAHAVAGRDDVERALAGLTPRERAVVVLRYLEDLTEKDTARLLNVSVGTVKTLHSRAMRRLRTDAGDAQGAHLPVAVPSVATSAMRKDTSCVDH